MTAIRTLFALLFSLCLATALAQVSDNNCSNIDFENADFSNWGGEIGCTSTGFNIRQTAPCANTYYGIDPNAGIDDAGAVAGSEAQHEIISTAFNGGRDPFIPGLSMQSPLPNDTNGNVGQYIARLGNYAASTAGVGGSGIAQAAELSYEIDVDSSNLIVQVAYAVVLQSPGHAGGQLPYFSINVIDPDGNKVGCFEYEVAGRNGEPGFSSFSTYEWRDWTLASLYLGSYFGQTVTVQFQTSDCYPEGHTGWAYVDASCGPLEMTATVDTICPVGDTTTVHAPAGMQNYNWYFVPDSIYEANRALYDGATAGAFPGVPIDRTRYLNDVSPSGIPIKGMRVFVEEPGHYFAEMTPFTTSADSCPFLLRYQIYSHPEPKPGYIVDEPYCQGTPVPFIDTTNFFHRLESTRYFLTGAERDSVDTAYTEKRFWLWDTAVTGGVEQYINSDTLYNSLDSNYQFVDNEMRPTSLGYLPNPNIVDTVGTLKIGLKHENEHECANIFYQEITIRPIDTIVFDDPGIICVDQDPFQLIANPKDGNWDGDDRIWSGGGVTPTGFFDPSFYDGNFGSHYVYLRQEPCGENDSLLLTIEDRADASFTMPQDHCPQDGAITLTPTQPGGDWIGTYVNSSGVYNPAGAPAGMDSVKYRILSNCPDSTVERIEIKLPENFDFNHPGSQCDVDVNITLDMEPTGGTWSGPGITGPTSGTWNPGNAGPGTWQLTYTLTDPCPTDTVIEITVINNPVATFTAPDTICNDEDPIFLMPVSPGGIWSGTGIVNPSSGQFDPGIANIGMNRVYYEFQGSCAIKDSADIYVGFRPQPMITPAGPFCDADTLIYLQVDTMNGIWSGNGITNANTGEFNPSLAAFGPNTITYSMSGVCPNSDQISVDVQAKTPVIIGNNPATYCDNDAAFGLNASPSGGDFSGPGVVVLANGVDYEFDPSLANLGSNRIYYTVPGACGGIDSLDLNVLEFKSAAITPVADQCASQDSVFVAVAPAGGIFSGAFTDTTFGPTFLPSQAGQGTHTIQYRFPEQCGSDSSLTVNVAAPIVITDIAITDVSCNGGNDGNAVLTTNGGSRPLTFNYTPGLAPARTDSIAHNLIAQTYQVNIVDQLGCTKDSAFTISQPTPLTFTFNTVDENCGSGDGSVEMTNVSGGTAPYTYNWTGGPTTALYAGVSAGSFEGTVTDANGCTLTQSTSITTSPAPTFDLNKVDVSCNGYADGEIIASNIGNSSGAIDHFLDGVQQSGPTAIGLSPGTYNWRIRDAVGCSSNQDITIVEPTPVQVSLPYQTDTLCISELDSLVGVAMGGNGGPYTFDWSLTQSVSSVDKLVYENPGTYTFQAWDAQGCPSNTLDLIVHQRAPLQITGNVNPGTICSGETTTFSAVANGGSGSYTFTWETDGIPYAETGGQLEASFVGDPNNPISVTVTVNDGCSPSAQTSIPLTFHPIPTPVVTPQDACEPFSPTISETSSSAAQWNWTVTNQYGYNEIFSGQSINLSNLPYGNYDFDLATVNSFGCTHDTTFSDLVISHQLPEAEIVWTPTNPDINSSVVTVFNRFPNNIETNSWSIVDLNNLTDTILGGNPSANYIVGEDSTTIVVNLRVASPFGCLDSASVTIPIQSAHEFYVPNTFSPNGDGVNETFIPVTFNIENQGYTLQIFNRWGELVFTSPDLNLGWNGIYQGEPAKPGVYIWKIKYQDHNREEKLLNGRVTLLR